jgi:hypothetical protein
VFPGGKAAAELKIFFAGAGGFTGGVNYLA